MQRKVKSDSIFIEIEAPFSRSDFSRFVRDSPQKHDVLPIDKRSLSIREAFLLLVPVSPRSFRGGKNCGVILNGRFLTSSGRLPLRAVSGVLSAWTLYGLLSRKFHFGNTHSK